MDKDLLKYLESYEKEFDDYFPLSSFATSTPARVIEIIKECLQEHQDVYDLEYLTLDDDVMY